MLLTTHFGIRLLNMLKYGNDVLEEKLLRIKVEHMRICNAECSFGVSMESTAALSNMLLPVLAPFLSE